MEKDQKKKILITGISGLLGSNLAFCFKDIFDVSGLYNAHSINIPGVRTECVDICNAKQIKEVVGDIHPDIILHCAALADVDDCEKNQALANQINVGGTENVINSLQSRRIKYIYISTDLVYGGEKGNYSEEDSVDPKNYYGLTKLKAEEVSVRRENALVLRTNLFGWNVRKKRSLGEWVIENLTSHSPINGFHDVYFSSIYTFDLAKIIEGAINSELEGVYNLGSRSFLSKYSFAKRIAQNLNLDGELITPISVDNAGLNAKRAKNLSLNVSKLAYRIKMEIPTFEESIDHFTEDYQLKKNAIFKTF